MIEHLENLPINMVGFKATGEVTDGDFKTILMTKAQKIKQHPVHLTAW